MKGNLTIALLIALAAGFVWLFWTLNRAEGNGFRIADAFCDPATSKASIARITTAIGAMVGAWLVIAMELNHRSNEVIVLGYLAFCGGVYLIGRLPQTADKPAGGA